MMSRAGWMVKWIGRAPAKVIFERRLNVTCQHQQRAGQHVVGHTAQIPYQAEHLKAAKDVIGQVEFPPEEALPGRAGKWWWLLCQPSPVVMMARIQLLRELSLVA